MEGETFTNDFPIFKKKNHIAIIASILNLKQRSGKQ